MRKRIIEFLMTVFDCFVILLALGFVYFMEWGAGLILRDIVPNEQTQFDSYEEFRIMAEYFMFPAETLPSSVGEKYFYYSVWMDRQIAVSFQLEETVYEEQKRKSVEERNEKWCDEQTAIHKYVWDEGEPKKVTREFMEAEGLMFVDHVCSKDLEEYSCLLEYKSNTISGFSAWGIICNDETKELIFYAYDDNDLFGVGDA